MKKLAVLLAVVSLLALAQAGYAADLQAGWYVRMYSVHYYVYDSYGLPVLAGNPSFQTVPGVYIPFLLTDGPYNWQYSREAMVENSVMGVGTASSLVLPVNTGMGQDQRLAYLDYGWETNYDSSQMQLEFWHSRADGGAELLWQQNLSGSRFGFTTTAYDLVCENGFFFRIAVIPVPEPASVVVLIAGVTALAFTRRRLQ